MRIRDLTGWPPRTFQNDRKKVVVTPPEPGRLILTTVSYVAGKRIDDPRGEIVMLLRDPVTDQACTARLTLHDVALARGAFQTLKACQDFTLAEVSEWLIVEG